MKRCLVTFILVLLIACSGDNGTAPDEDDGGNGGGGGAPTLADTLRVEAVETLASQLDQWTGMSADTIAARAVAYLGTLPTIEDAGVTPGTTTVWARFTDDVMLIIPNNRDLSSAADTLVDPPSLPEPPAVERPPVTVPEGRRMVTALSAPDKGLELPVPATFRAVNPIGTCHVDPLPVLKSLLRGGGYVDARPGPATVEGLKAVRGDGVFYINTHGAVGIDGNQTPQYALWTATPFDIANLTATYKQMLLDGELAVVVQKTNDPQGGCSNLAHYGVTALFVNRYMRFAKHSLVVIDACESASVAAIDMRQAFANAGASVYVGWTRKVNDSFAYSAMKYMIDRLLGVNRISPESPKQRAFNIDDVREDMATNRNLVDDPYQHAILTVFHMKDDFGLLSPSIQFLSVEEGASQSELIIAGMFGTDPGSGHRAVKINDQALDVIEWQPNLIRCDLPVAGASAAGTVVVEVGAGANPRLSNAVNLTEWRGEMKYERDDPGNQRADMTLKVHFRADVHSFRDKPHETPWETTVLFGAMRDASMEVTAGGTYSRTQGDCTDTFPMSGAVNVPSPWEPTLEGGWSYLGSVDTQHHELQLNMWALSLFPGARWIRTGPAECAPNNIALYISVKIDDCLYDDLQGVKAFRISMGSDFSVSADTRGPWVVLPHVAPLADLTGEASMHWDAFTVSHPPDPDAAR
jgi:hypothetical protein